MNGNGSNNVAHGTRTVVLGHGGGAKGGMWSETPPCIILAPSWIRHPAVVVVVHGAGDDAAGCVNAHIAEQGPMTTTTWNGALSIMWNVGGVDDVECGRC
jgi:hypothetical protein